MANFAVIDNQIVENVILADSKAIAEEVTGKTCVEYANETMVHIGATWDGSNFINPPEPPIE